jgi:hypothetical protein
MDVKARNTGFTAFDGLFGDFFRSIRLFDILFFADKCARNGTRYDDFVRDIPSGLAHIPGNIFPIID